MNQNLNAQNSAPLYADGNVAIFASPPPGFSAKVEVAAIYVRLNGKLLFLKLAPHKQEAGSWGVPAGKVEVGEALAKGAKRELFEETGLIVDEAAVESLGTLYMRKSQFDYVYHLFEVQLEEEREIQLSIEHEQYRWVELNEVQNLPLMQGAPYALQYYFRLTAS